MPAQHKRPGRTARMERIRRAREREYRIYQNRPVACREYVCIDDERINREAMNMG